MYFARDLPRFIKALLKKIETSFLNIFSQNNVVSLILNEMFWLIETFDNFMA